VAIGESSETVIDDDAELAQLAALPPLVYERERPAAAKRLGITRLSVLDKLVKAARGGDDPAPGQGRPLDMPEPDPWPHPVNGSGLLGALVATLRRHVVMDAAAADGVALWTLACHAFDCFSLFPRLAIMSPEKRCGKTTLLDVLARLVPRPLLVANVTAAAVFRTIEKARPTLLIDEADTFLAGREELRGVLNSGHRRDGNVVRCVGDDAEPRQFSTWSPAAVAAIGRLPATLEDRSLVVHLRRRRQDEPAAPLRHDRTEGLTELARKAARFARDTSASLAAADPEMPPGLFNRTADNWRPLLAVADIAAGEWPARARAAALALSLGQEAEGDQSVRVLLLGDLRALFDEEPSGVLFSEEIVGKLVRMEDRPWPEFSHGKPITKVQLARLLKPFGVWPSSVRRERETAKGYRREALADAFARYLPDQAVTPSQPAENLGFAADPQTSQRPPCDVSEALPKPRNSAPCDVVTDRSPPREEEEEMETWTA